MANTPGNNPDDLDGDRRDFLLISTTTLGLAGVTMAAWPFIHSINPAKDVLALSSTEVDLSTVEVGMAITAIVDTVARRLTRAKLSEVEDRARRYILRHFADTGRGPRIPEIQRHLQLASREDAKHFP